MNSANNVNNLPVEASIPQEDTGRRLQLSEPAMRCSLVFLTLVACLLILEAGLRLTGRYKISGPIGFHAARGVSYGVEANISKTINWPTHSFTINTCDQGFRSAYPGPCPIGGRPHYAILGSSEVFGNGLDYNETFIGVLARKMEADGIDIHNLAAPGHHFLEQESIFKEYIAQTEHMPRLVMICLNPLFVGGYDDIHANVTVRRGELFDKDHWKLPYVRWIISSSSAAYCFFRDGIRNLQAQIAPRRDFPLQFYVDRYSIAHPIHQPDKNQDFVRRLRGLEDYIRSIGATPVVAYFPTVGGFELDQLKVKGQMPLGLADFDTQFFVELAQAHCQSENIPFINTEPMLQEMHSRGETLNFRGDAHFNGPASAKIGEFLYSSLRVISNRVSK